MSENKQYLKKIYIEKVVGDEVNEEEDVTITEERVSIFLNGEKAISMMTIPKDSEAHAIGFLMSESVIESIDDVNEIKVSDDKLKIEVDANINEASLNNIYKEKTLVSGCGGGVTGNIAGQVEIPFNQTNFYITTKTIFEEVSKFYKESELYTLTGCVHKARLFLEDGSTVEAEDIGRHNAIDKTVGKAKLQRLNTDKSMLIVSGRLSSEMVVKAVMHKIPIVVSRTAPTYLGVQTALNHGITLIGFARGKRMNIYTHSGRIKT